MNKRFLTMSLIIACCGLVLSGCGRKGPLEPPPSAMIEGGNGEKIQKPKQDKPFILDGLIK